MIPKIIFHSDDYGISDHSCRQILDCCDQGQLQSVAILANSRFYDQSLELLRPYVQQGRLSITVHLNLVEGPSVTPAVQIPHLVDERGFFKLSFGQMLLQTSLHPHGPLIHEIHLELKNQITRVMTSFPDVSIGLDSHQHFHMIPAIFRTVIELIDETGISLHHLRFASEPLLPFLREPSFYKTYRPINLVKNLTLGILGLWDHRYLKNRSYEVPLFFGLMLSGCMDQDRVEVLLPRFYRIAQKKGCNLEVLSHPCGVSDPSECMAPDKKGFVAFYLSEGRQKEADMLKHIAVKNS